MKVVSGRITLYILFQLVPANIYVREENSISEFPNNGILECFSNAQPQNPNAQQKVFLVEGERERENPTTVSSTTGLLTAAAGNTCFFCKHNAYKHMKAQIW